MNKKQSGPLFHISKRAALPWYRAWGIRRFAIILALIVSALITGVTTGLDPLKIYATIFTGAFGTARKSWITAQNVAILLCISLAVTPAFKMRFWNIGAEGQVLIGGLASAACMKCLAGVLPGGALIAVMVVSSVAAGAIWAGIPAIFKAKWNTNETLFTLMMNYVATQLVAYLRHRVGGAKGRRADRHHQPEHRGRMAPVVGGQQVPSERACRGGADGVHIRLPQLFKARV